MKSKKHHELDLSQYKIFGKISLLQLCLVVGSIGIISTIVYECLI